MRIRCWGSRGSIAVSGPEYLVYGGDTTCLEIRSKNDEIIIIDAGTGLRRLGNSLTAQERTRFHFLFTHAHWDHLMGFPFFKPLFNPQAVLHMHGCPFSQPYVEKIVSRVMAPPNFPLGPSDIKAALEYEAACPMEFSIDTISITPIALNHPNQGAGYKFVEDGHTFVFLTDNELDFHHRGGLGFADYAAFCKGADLLIHDAEFTQEEYETATRGWGHTRYDRAVDLAVEAGAARLGLFHLNQDRTDTQIDRIVADCGRMAREKNADLECFAVARDSEFVL